MGRMNEAARVCGGRCRLWVLNRPVYFSRGRLRRSWSFGLFWEVLVETPIRIRIVSGTRSRGWFPLFGIVVRRQSRACRSTSKARRWLSATTCPGSARTHETPRWKLRAKDDQLEGVGDFHEHKREFPGSLKSVSEKYNFNERLPQPFRHDWVIKFADSAVTFLWRNFTNGQCRLPPVRKLVGLLAAGCAQHHP